MFFGVLGAYSLVVDQLELEWPTVSKIWSSWQYKEWIILILILVIAVLIDFLVRILRINTGKSQPNVEMVVEITQKELKKLRESIGQLGDRIAENQLSNMEYKQSIETIDKINEVTEKVIGRPLRFLPDTTLGDVAVGSNQTFSGLTIEDSPISFNLPGYNQQNGYGIIIMERVNNDIVKVEFLAYIHTFLHQPLTIRVGSVDEGEYIFFVFQLNPFKAKGFITQVNKAPLGKIGRGLISIFIEIDSTPFKSISNGGK